MTLAELEAELEAMLRAAFKRIAAGLEQLAREVESSAPAPPALPASPEAPRPPRRRGGRPRADLPPKACEVCSTTFHRRTDDEGHVTEHLADYRKRRTCSRSCGAILRQRLRAASEPPAATPTPAAKKRRGVWTPDQIAILEATYPNGGAQAARDALSAAGHPERTIGTIRAKANRIGLTVEPRAADTPDDDRVLALLRDYRGLPLTVDDIHDELNLKRTQARHILDRLTEVGHLHSEPDPSYTGRGQVPIIYRAKEVDQCSTT